MISMDRRTVLTAPAALSLAAATAACADEGGPAARSRSATLVAYFSRSGNTKVIAGTLQRALGAELFEIQPAKAYPEDYEQTVEQNVQELRRHYLPPLKSRVSDFGRYATIFLGFPIWDQTMPPVVRSFVKAHDMSGRTVRPFITHGGYGAGDSLAVLTTLAPGARIEPPFVMEADQERRTLNEVTGWLERIGAN